MIVDIDYDEIRTGGVYGMMNQEMSNENVFINSNFRRERTTV